MSCNRYTRTPAERFWEKVRKTADCWIWTGAIGSGGYGSIRIMGSTRRANRVSWEIHNGKIPESDGYHGTCVLHRCDNRLCVNPDHLFLGTQHENIEDMDAKGRRISVRGVKHHKAKLDNICVGLIRDIYSGGKFTQAQIAEFFGVSDVSISCIVNRHTWQHV